MLYRFTENRLNGEVNIGQCNAEIITRVSMHFGEFARFKVLFPNSAAGSCDTLTAASNDAPIADGADKDV